MSITVEQFVLDEDLPESVLITPSGVTSYIHENMIKAGKPIINNTTINLILHSGSNSAGKTILQTCNIIKDAAA